MRKATLKNITSDGGKGYKALPSSAATRTYRSPNRDITLHKTENKENAMIAAENYDHVQTPETRVKEVGSCTPES